MSFIYENMGLCCDETLSPPATKTPTGQEIRQFRFNFDSTSGHKHRSLVMRDWHAFDRCWATVAANFEHFIGFDKPISGTGTAAPTQTSPQKEPQKESLLWFTDMDRIRVIVFISKTASSLETGNDVFFSAVQLLDRFLDRLRNLDPANALAEQFLRIFTQDKLAYIAMAVFTIAYKLIDDFPEFREIPELFLRQVRHNDVSAKMQKIIREKLTVIEYFVAGVLNWDFHTVDVTAAVVKTLGVPTKSTAKNHWQAYNLVTASVASPDLYRFFQTPEELRECVVTVANMVKNKNAAITSFFEHGVNIMNWQLALEEKFHVKMNNFMWTPEAVTKHFYLYEIYEPFSPSASVTRCAKRRKL